MKPRQHLKRNRLRQALSAGHRRRVATARKAALIVAASVAVVAAVTAVIVTVAGAVVRDVRVRVTKRLAKAVILPVKCVTKAVKRNRAVTTSVVQITATSRHANRASHANRVNPVSHDAARRARVRMRTLRSSPLSSPRR